MTQKTFSFVCGVIFLMIAILHLARILLGWHAEIGGWTVPMWLSWIALLVAAYFGYQGISFGKK